MSAVHGTAETAAEKNCRKCWFHC